MEVIIVVWVAVSLLFATFYIIVTPYDDIPIYFNPKKNYEKWIYLNWFGVWTFTILYWVICPVFLIFLAIIMGIYKLFTKGRR